MKNLISIVSISLVAISGFSQKENTKQLDAFTQLKAYDRIIVNLVKGGENKLVVTGDDKDEIKISNKDGLLKIRMEMDNFMDGDEVKATLYYTEILTLIDANENAQILSDETVKGDRVEIKTQEGGKVSLKVDLQDLYAKSVSGGEVNLKGSAKMQEVLVNTGGSVYNKELNTTETNVVVSAGGRADVKASEKVKAKVRAGGYIYIHGNPKEVEKDKVFGGKIEIVD